MLYSFLPGALTARVVFSLSGFVGDKDNISAKLLGEALLCIGEGVHGGAGQPGGFVGRQLLFPEGLLHTYTASKSGEVEAQSLFLLQFLPFLTKNSS